MAAVTTTVTRTMTDVGVVPGTQGSKTVPKIPGDNPTTYLQSLELVEVMILVAVSLITDIRNLLPSESFEERGMQDILKDLVMPSKNRVAFSQCSAGRAATKKYKTVNRKASAGTQKLYTWLDGVFEGISKQYVDSVQLSIIAEKDKPDRVLESYLFSVLYTSNQKGHQHVSLKMTSSVNSKQITLCKARSSLYAVISHVDTLLRNLPDLPGTRYLSLNLFFTEHRPSNWNPLGFRSSNSTTMLLPKHAQWSIRSDHLGTAALGAHAIQIKVVHLFNPGVSAPGVVSRDTLTSFQIPANFEFGKLVSRLTFSDMPDGNSLMLVRNKFANLRRSSTVSTPSTSSLLSTEVLPETPQVAKSQRDDDPPTLPISQTRESVDDLAGLSNSSSIQARLHLMAKSSPINPRLTQTQEQASIGTQSNFNSNWRLIAEKDEELFRKREAFLTQVDPFSSIAKISCQCGIGGEEGEMIACDCCEEWQHKHCYALDQVDDGHLGDTHACYPCLLGSGGVDVLPNMKDVARLRRTCWIVRSAEGAISFEALIEKSRYPRNEVEVLVHALTDCGMIVLKDDKVYYDESAAKASFNSGGLLHPLSYISQFFESGSECGINSSALRRQKRLLADADITAVSDSDGLGRISPLKRRKQPATPRHDDAVHLPLSSLEVQSPLDVRGDF